MGGATSACKINFVRMQQCVNEPDTIIIHTMSTEYEKCLIKGTLTAQEEVNALNDALHSYQDTTPIVVYGKNACDASIVVKYNQLVQLGFSNVMVYPGGMLEWILLRNYYDNSELFPTSGVPHEHAVLDYKGD